jgi:hypothetical protein
VEEVKSVLGGTHFVEPNICILLSVFVGIQNIPGMKLAAVLFGTNTLTFAFEQIPAETFQSKTILAWNFAKMGTFG